MTIVWMPFLCSLAIARLAVLTVEAKVSPAMPPRLTILGVDSVVRSITPTLTPRRWKISYGAGCKKGLPVDWSMTLADQYGKVAQSTCFVSVSVPASNSWLPNVTSSYPMALATSMVGLSSNAALSSGVAPTRSPPSTVRVPSGLLASARSRYAASHAAPPAGDPLTVCGLSLPWKSLVERTWILTVRSFDIVADRAVAVHTKVIAIITARAREPHAPTTRLLVQNISPLVLLSRSAIRSRVYRFV